MNLRRRLVFVGTAIPLLWMITGCGGSSSLSPRQQEEFQRLRVENAEVRRLRSENSELPRLRRDNEEVAQLRGLGDEIARLRLENESLQQQLAVYPAPKAPPVPAAPPKPADFLPIEDLVSAFEEAAIVVASQGEEREEDLPKEGDNILIDQSVIGFLIPEFKDNTNGGPYEVSGWLSSKGVAIKNYQQFNYLGITNYHIRRAPPKELNQSN